MLQELVPLEFRSAGSVERDGVDDLVTSAKGAFTPGEQDDMARIAESLAGIK